MLSNVKKLLKNIGDSEAKFAKKALNYYDGNQIEELEHFLRDSGNFRQNWKQKGAIPRSRNIVKAVIDKSGLLFNNNPPILSVWEGDTINQTASEQLKQLLENANWVETFINFDNQIRLLKSGIMLIQWDNENKKLVLDSLHRGNCSVIVNPNTKEITELLVQLTTDEDADSDFQYRHFSMLQITDYSYDKETKELVVISQFDNPYGIIPVAQFYDTASPRYGIWNIVPSDLIGLNEMYNLHIMDSEYAASWAKVKTLFTNAEIADDSHGTQTWVDPSTGIPRQVPASPSTVGGPGRIVQIDSGSGQQVFLEYKGPDVSLSPIDDMFGKWVKDFAADWSVRLTNSDQTSASSGFQLLVEEIPNLELRRQRQKMFEAGFARMYKVLVYVTSTIPGISLPAKANLFAEFSAANLPVDNKAQEEVWSRRITEGRASRLDYFMETKNLSREEAMEKIAEIDALNNAAPATPIRNQLVRVT